MILNNSIPYNNIKYINLWYKWGVDGYLLNKISTCSILGLKLSKFNLKSSFFLHLPFSQEWLGFKYPFYYSF